MMSLVNVWRISMNGVNNENNAIRYDDLKQERHSNGLLAKISFKLPEGFDVKGDKESFILENLEVDSQNNPIEITKIEVPSYRNDGGLISSFDVKETKFKFED